MKRTFRCAAIAMLTLCAILFTSSCAIISGSNNSQGDTEEYMTKDEVNRLIAGIQQNVTVEGGDSYNVTINSDGSKNLLAASKALLSAVSISCTFKVTTSGYFGVSTSKKETAAYSSILAWNIPWTEEPGIRSQRA